MGRTQSTFRGKTRLDPDKLWFTLVVLVIIYFLYGSPLLYPFTMFATLVHEACHALMAILTGGKAHSIYLMFNTSGLALTSGGNPILVYSAGYVGTAVFAAGLIMLDQRPQTNQLALNLLGLFSLIVTAWLVRNPYGLVFGLLFGALLLYLAAQNWPTVHHWIIRGLAIFLMANSINDIIRLPAIHRAGGVTDAILLYQNYFIPPLMSVAVWFVISVLVLFYALRVSLEE